MKLLILIIILPTILNFEFKEKDGKTGIEFINMSPALISFEKWKICYYYELDNYINEIENFKENMKIFEQICEKLKEDNKICYAYIYVTKFKKYSEKINFDENLTKSNIRTKRAILEIEGKIYYHIFGLLGQDQAKYYNDKIDEIQTNAEKENELSKQQLSIIRSSLEINDHTFQDFNNKINEIFSELQKQNNRQLIQENIHFLSQSSTIIMINHNELFDIILEIVTNTIQSKIFKLIPNELLKSELKNINKLLPINKKLPIDTENDDIYKILNALSIRTNLIKNRIIIEIQIPIVFNTEYQLFKSIPIPTQVNDKLIIIKPDQKYFLIDTNHTEIIPLEWTDMQNCKEITTKIICNPHLETLTDKYGKCILSILGNKTEEDVEHFCTNFITKIPNENYFIRLDKNKFFCYIRFPTIFHSFCPGREVKNFIIKKSGILELKNQCYLIKDDMKIIASNEVEFGESHEIIIPRDNLNLTNILHNMSKFNNENYMDNQSMLILQKMEKSQFNVYKEIEEIAKQRQEFTFTKANREITEGQNDDIFGLMGITSIITTIIYYSIIFITIMIMITIFYKIRKCCK